jgi:hypothetical protein
MNRYIIYYTNPDGTKEKILNNGFDEFDAALTITRFQVLKIVNQVVLESDVQPEDSEDYIWR